MCNVEDEYQQTVAKLLADAKIVSDKYEMSHPECTIKYQNYQTSFRELGWKPSFTNEWGYPYDHGCPRCSQAYEHKRVLATCGMGGGTCGSYINCCTVCGLTDVSTFDQS